MRHLIVFATLLLAAALVSSGCGSRKDASRVSPKTMPDQSSAAESIQQNEGADENSNEGYSYENTPLELLTVHFEYDKYDLTPEALDILSANAEALAKHPGAVVKIEGHCDERGTEEYNMALGEKRAQTVRSYLLNYGINPNNINIISYGELTPVDRGHSESAWRKNRRADFVVQSE